MIVEGLFNIFFSILTNLFQALPNISWATDSSAMTTFLGFISVIMYLLPMGTVVTIFSLVVSLMVFRIVISIIKTIWDLLLCYR